MRIKLELITLPLLIAALAALILSAGCLNTGPDHVDVRTVEAESASKVSTKVEMKAGELNVSGGASTLAEAEFTYNVPAFKPDVTYTETNEVGELLFEQPSVRTVFFLSGQSRNQWDLRFSDSIPMDVEFELAATESQLDLGDLNIGKAEVNAGAGDVHVKLTGQPDLGELNMELGAGKTTVDLGGMWRKDVHVNIEGGVGDIAVRVPSDVGVKLAIDVGIGSIDVQGLFKDGEFYFNEEWEDNPVAIELNIEGGVGRISVSAD